MGMSLSGLIKNKIGYIGNFGIAMGCAVAAMLYAIFFLKDSRKLRPAHVMEQLELFNATYDNPTLEENKGCDQLHSF
jgi:predicted MFS family arabinose efflux permease